MVKKKIAAIGGSVIKRVLQHGKLADIETEQCLWIHPFTLGNLHCSPELDAKNRLDKFLTECKSEYLLLEVSDLRASLFETKEGCFYRYADVKKYQGSGGISLEGEVRSPLDVKENLFEKSLESLRIMLEKKWGGQKIILISAVPLPGYINNGGYFISGSERWRNISRLIWEYEGALFRGLGCHYIDITQFYIPYGQADSYSFSDRFYTELEDKIWAIMGRENAGYVCGLSDEHRYFTVAEVMNSIYRKSALNRLLDIENIVDTCVAYTNRAFIEANISELANLKEKTREQKDLKKQRQLLDERNPLERILLVIFKVLHEEKLESQEYEYILRRHFEIEKEICEKTGDKLEGFFSGFSKKMVTVQNVKEYLRILDLEERGEFGKAEEKMWQIKNPILVDIWGSCISRFIFDYADETEARGRLVVNRYVYHANPLNFNKGMEDYKQVKGLRENVYAEQNLKIQLEGQLKNYYMNSGSPWIIVDFYALFSSDVFRCKEVLIVCGNNTGEKYFTGGKAKRIFHELSYEEILDGLKEFAEFLNKRYGGHIILIGAHNTERYQKNGSTCFFHNQSEIREINAFLKRIELDFANICGCYYINLSQYVLSDDMWMLEMSPFHFEKRLYMKEYEIIEKICSGAYDSSNKIISEWDAPC